MTTTIASVDVGGTGVTTSTGSGSNVLNSNPTITNPTLGGATSGGVTLAVPAVAGSNTATLPAATGTVMVSGNMPAFSAYVANAYTLSYNVTTKVPFDTKVFDTNTNFSTANNRFTPTVAGYYLINSFIGVAGSGGTQTGSLGLVMDLYKNGGNFAQLGVSNAAASYPYLNCSQLVYANGTTDYFEIWIYSNANVSGVPIQNGQTYTSFSAALIRSA